MRKFSTALAVCLRVYIPRFACTLPHCPINSACITLPSHNAHPYCACTPPTLSLSVSHPFHTVCLPHSIRYALSPSGSSTLHVSPTVPHCVCITLPASLCQSHTYYLTHSILLYLYSLINSLYEGSVCSNADSR